MANICLDTVVFYCDEGNNELLKALGTVVEKCYPPQMPCYKQQISVLTEHLGLDTNGLSLRGDVSYYDVTDDYIKLYVDTAWTPLYGCYQAIARHFGLNFVMRSEEPGCGLFINTDVDGRFMAERYRLCLSCDGAVDAMYKKLYEEQPEREAYFETEQELLEYLSKYGFEADTFDKASELLDKEYVCINEFRENYE